MEQIPELQGASRRCYKLDVYTEKPAASAVPLSLLKNHAINKRPTVITPTFLNIEFVPEERTKKRRAQRPGKSNREDICQYPGIYGVL